MVLLLHSRKAFVLTKVIQTNGSFSIPSLGDSQHQPCHCEWSCLILHLRLSPSFLPFSKIKPATLSDIQRTIDSYQQRLDAFDRQDPELAGGPRHVATMECPGGTPTRRTVVTPHMRGAGIPPLSGLRGVAKTSETGDGGGGSDGNRTVAGLRWLVDGLCLCGWCSRCCCSRGERARDRGGCL